MSENSIVDALGEIQFLRGMPSEYVERIAQIAQIRDYRANDVVFREGQAAQRMYLVVSGSVSLEVCAASLGCRQILTLGPGELVGWSSLLDQSRYTARARVPQSARLIEIDVAQLRALCDRDTQFGYEIMQRTALALAKRLSGTRMQLLDAYGNQLHQVEP